MTFLILLGFQSFRKASNRFFLLLLRISAFSPFVLLELSALVPFVLTSFGLLESVTLLEYYIVFLSVCLSSPCLLVSSLLLSVRRFDDRKWKSLSLIVYAVNMPPDYTQFPIVLLMKISVRVERLDQIIQNTLTLTPGKQK